MKKWLNKNIIGFSLASFFNDFCHEMITALLPSFIGQISSPTSTPTALGIIQGLSDAASTIMKLLSGFLADRVPYYKPFLVVGYGLTSIVAFIGTATSMWMVVFYKTIAWMSRGIREPMRDTWLSKIVSPHFYGRVFGFQRACDTLGALLGPLCALILLKCNFSVRSIFFISFIPGILSAVPILLLTREKKESPKKHLPNFKEQLKKFPAHFNYFLFIMFLFGIGNFNQVLFLYRAQELFSEQLVSSFFATSMTVLFYIFFNVVRAMSEFGMGTLSDYVNRKNLLAIFGFGSFVITCIAFMITTFQVWFWFLFFGIAGLSAGTVKALEKAYAADLLPEHVRGTGFGVLQAIDGIGDLISSFIVGSLWSLFSANIGFLYALSLSFTAMILLLIKNLKNET